MRSQLVVVVVCFVISVTDAILKCRQCIKASSLDDCTQLIPCPAGDICYMDEVVTDQLFIEYNGGCRPREVCQQSRPIIGKRQGSTSEPVCSACCDTIDCNKKMCGIRSTMFNVTQCYHCTTEDPRGGGLGVSNPNDCTTFATCSSDEVCAAETYRLSSQETYEFKCLKRNICTMITMENMKWRDSCRSNPAACPELGGVGKRTSGPGGVGRRSTSGHLVCTACCGDGGCNFGTCEDLQARLYQLYQRGLLDFHTLKYNSRPVTTTAQTPITTNHHG